VRGKGRTSKSRRTPTHARMRDTGLGAGEAEVLDAKSQPCCFDCCLFPVIESWSSELPDASSPFDKYSTLSFLSKLHSPCISQYGNPPEYLLKFVSGVVFFPQDSVNPNPSPNIHQQPPGRPKAHSNRLKISPLRFLFNLHIV
jgi:hypothetical protein